MIEEILKPTNWIVQSVEDQLLSASENRDKGRKPQGWYNPTRSISPLALYKYLKARFGSPNGFVMFLKNPSSDNLIHWHYALSTPQAIINIWGKTSGLEISVKPLDDLLVTEKDWLQLEANLKAAFKQYNKEMKVIQAQFEHWALFINPFSRIEQTVKDSIVKLERLNLDEIVNTPQGSKESLDEYHKELKRWTNNIDKAATLGTTIRMLCPVMAEAFINLLLLIFRKDEYKNDERLYESLTRQQIDVRVKTLHLHCICFPKQIDCTSVAFKNFHTLMNGRNDFLHGNIDPNKLIVEEVWFDQKIIPLFEKDEGFIKKMMRNYCTNVERQKALGDFQIVSDFIELVYMAMEEDYLKQFVHLLADRMPGINKKTKRLGALFPAQYLVEGHVY